MTTNDIRRGSARAGTRSAGLVSLVCWLTVALEGFDLVAFGAVIPTLTETHHLGMNGDDLTLVATLSLVGVGIGAGAGGPLIDRFGRRVGLTLSVAIFSVFTILVPFAPTVPLLAATRLVAGLGLGSCMPTAITIMTESSRADRKATATTSTMTGYHVGAVAMSLFALLVIPHWHLVFILGGVAGLVLLPFVWTCIPETSPLARHGEAGAMHPTATASFGAPGSREASGSSSASTPGSASAPGSASTPDSASTTSAMSSESASPSVTAAGTTPRPQMLDLLRSHRRTLLCSWLASFMGLLLVYGLNTWLPQIMRSAGYSLTKALSLLLIMNAGAIAGLALGGVVADRRGIRASTIAWFAASAAFLALLSVRMDDAVVLHAVVFVTGLFVFSAQGLVYALVAHLVEPEVRGTALGLASGVGRLGAIVGPAITGMLATRGLAYPWGFYVFAGVAVLATLAVALMPAHPAPRRDVVDAPAVGAPHATF